MSGSKVCEKMSGCFDGTEPSHKNLYTVKMLRLHKGEVKELYHKHHKHNIMTQLMDLLQYCIR